MRTRPDCAAARWTMTACVPLRSVLHSPPGQREDARRDQGVADATAGLR